jgi:rhodanese-related sulfurtransferase
MSASRPPLAAMRRFWPRLLIEALVLAAIGAVAGLARNAARTEPLPYDLPETLLLAESGARPVFAREALRLYEAGDFIFVDAREPEEFLAGHVAGALSLPAGRCDELYDSLRLWAGGQPLLVYAGRDNFLPADELAHRLRERGEPRVLVLAAGFEGWAAQGCPVEAGTDGILDPEELE